MELTMALFALGFAALIKGADLLVDGAAAIARRMNVSDLVIGLTVVSFGTSAPELFVNVLAGLKGTTGIAIGNVLGSNIANVLLILGVSSLIYPLSVSRGTVWKEIPLSLLAAIVLGTLANDDLIDKTGASAVTRTDGIVLLCFFAIFLYYTFSIAQRIDGMEEHIPEKPRSTGASIALIVAGLISLILGGKWIVDGAVGIALKFGISESLVGLTIVAVGTSLPELATSAMAAWRGNVEIAVGNVVGSNIFNIFFVLAVSAAIRPLPFTPASNLDIGVVMLSSLFLFLFMFTGKRHRLDRWEGVMFLFIYIGYLVLLIMTA